jgi:hypothetical protein
MEQSVSQPNMIMDEITSKLLRGEMCLSYSALSAFKEAPAKFVEYKMKQKVTTDAMVYGSMVHCLVLEPDDFENRYFTFDDSAKCADLIAGGAKSPRATKAYKEWYLAETEGAGERIVVTPDDFRHAKAVAHTVICNRASSKVLRLCPKREKGVEWEYKNFKFHGFIDGDGEENTFDLKTCADASPAKFQRDLVQMGYHMQAAMYMFGNQKVKNYYIIAVDKNGGVSVHKLHDKLIEKGMEEYDRLVGKFNECILSEGWDQSYDYWSERFDGIYSAEAPTWMF